MDTYRSSIIPREQSLLEQGEAAREQEAIDVEVIHHVTADRSFVDAEPERSHDDFAAQLGHCWQDAARRDLEDPGLIVSMRPEVDVVTDQGVDGLSEGTSISRGWLARRTVGESEVSCVLRLAVAMTMNERLRASEMAPPSTSPNNPG